MDLTPLGLRVESQDVDTAEKRLDSLTESAKGAERAADGLAGGSKRAGGAIASMLANIEKAVREQNLLLKAQNDASFAMSRQAAEAEKAAAKLAKVGAQAKVTATHFDTLYDAASRDFAQQYTAGMSKIVDAQGKGAKSSKQMSLAVLDLSRQFADVGVTAAMGMNPLMILIQQGPQIADRLATMKMEGIGLAAALRAMTAAAAPFLAVIIPIGLAVGAAFGGAALAARELNKDNADLVDSLGLTEKQLKRLKDQGVDTGVTMGDVFRGTFDYIREAVGPALAPIGKWFSDLFDDITAKAIWAVKTIGGAFVGAYAAIKTTWSGLPAALGDVAIQAGNAVVRAIESAINKALTAYNKALPLIRALMTATGNGAGAMGLREAGPVSLGQMDNPWSGAAAKTMEDGAAAFKKANEGWADTVDSVGQGLRKSILDAARDRIKGAAGDAEKAKKDQAAAQPARDTTDERAAQLAQLLAQAQADELRAQLDLTEDVRARADIEKAMVDAQLAAQRAQLDRQAAAIADDKGLSEANKALLLMQLEAVKVAQDRAAGLKQEKIERDATRKITQDSNAVRTAGIQNEIDILVSQREVARFGFERREIDREILAAQQQIERLKLEEIVATTASTSAEHQIAKARLKVLDIIHANQRKSAMGTAEDAFNDVARALEDVVRAFEEQDWQKLVKSLVEAFGTLVSIFKKSGASLESKIGALAGVGSVIGQAVGGKGGSAISGAASGAMAGMTIGSMIPGIGTAIGAAVGAVVGGVGGWLSGGKEEKRAKQEREAADIANARAIAQQRANQQAELELRILELSGDEVGALAKRREAELAALDGANRALAEHVHALEDWATAVGKAKDAVAKAEDDLREAYEAEKKRLEGVIGSVQGARERLSQAYQRERGEIENTISSLTSAVKSFADFRNEIGMLSAANDPSAGYAFARSRFDSATNDNLIERGRAFADASMSASATELDYQRDLAAVRRRTDEAAKTAQNQLTTAERQLAALDALVEPLIGANDNLLSVDEAIRGLSTAEQDAAAATAELARLDAQVGALININTSVLTVAQAITNLQTAIAALAAAEAAKPTQNGPAGGYEAVGYAGYVDRNPDLAALYASGSGMAKGRSKEEFGAYHWERYGQAEERAYRPFARGGVFTNGIVSEPTTFDMGLMGEAGSEAIMPLTMGPNGLGVRASGGDTSRLEALVSELKAEVAALRVTAGKTAANTKNMDERGKRQEFNGVYVRGQAPEEPIVITGTVEVAA